MRGALELIILWNIKSSAVQLSYFRKIFEWGRQDDRPFLNFCSDSPFDDQSLKQVFPMTPLHLLSLLADFPCAWRIPTPARAIFGLKYIKHFKMENFHMISIAYIAPIPIVPSQVPMLSAQALRRMSIPPPVL